MVGIVKILFTTPKTLTKSFSGDSLMIPFSPIHVPLQTKNRQILVSWASLTNHKSSHKYRNIFGRGAKWAIVRRCKLYDNRNTVHWNLNKAAIRMCRCILPKMKLFILKKEWLYKSLKFVSGFCIHSTSMIHFKTRDTLFWRFHVHGKHIAKNNELPPKFFSSILCEWLISFLESAYQNCPKKWIIAFNLNIHSYMTPPPSLVL